MTSPKDEIIYLIVFYLNLVMKEDMPVLEIKFEFLKLDFAYFL